MLRAKSLAILGLLGTALLQGAPDVHATEPTALPTAAQVESLLERVSRLEKQNQELQAKLAAEPKESAVETGDILTDVTDPTSADVAPAEVSDPLAESLFLTPEESDDNELSMKASWRYGLEIESKNKNFRVHIGGRTQVDFVWMAAADSVQYGSTNATGPIDNGVDFRRGRLRADGTMYEIIEWAVEYDFFNTVNVEPQTSGDRPNTLFADNQVANVPGPTDLWFTITKLPVVGNWRIGNMKEPIGFEHLVSSRYHPFLERSFNQDAFTGPFNNGFTPGAMFFDTMLEERGTWWIGAFRNTQNVFAFDTSDDAYAFTGRLTALPIYAEEGKRLLHLGVAGSHRILSNDQVAFRARTSVRAGPSTQWPILANTGVIAGTTEEQLDLELAGVWGPFNIQGDYFFNFTETDNFGMVYFQGAYLEGLYFLTGEHREYDRKAAVFGRVIPKRNFLCVKDECGKRFGPGAWQVGMRYAFLDLTDGGIQGGRLYDWTFGLNWFLNPNMKMQFNYDLTYREATRGDNSGAVHGLGVRVAHDF